MAHYLWVHVIEPGIKAEMDLDTHKWYLLLHEHIDEGPNLLRLR